jgi:hypothetical protein
VIDPQVLEFLPSNQAKSVEPGQELPFVTVVVNELLAFAEQRKLPGYEV